MTARTETAIFPLPTVLFPGGPLPLRIFEPRYVDMVGRCMKGGEPFLVTAIADDGETSTRGFENIGTLAYIVDFETLPGGLLGIVARGGERACINRHYRRPDGLDVGDVETLNAEPLVELPDEYAGVAVLLHELMEQSPEIYRDVPRAFGDASWVGYRLVEMLPMNVEQKQRFLEMQDAMQRLEILRPVLESIHPDAL